MTNFREMYLFPDAAVGEVSKTEKQKPEVC